MSSATPRLHIYEFIQVGSEGAAVRVSRWLLAFFFLVFWVCPDVGMVVGVLLGLHLVGTKPAPASDSKGREAMTVVGHGTRREVEDNAEALTFEHSAVSCLRLQESRNMGAHGSSGSSVTQPPTTDAFSACRLYRASHTSWSWGKAWEYTLAWALLSCW